MFDSIKVIVLTLWNRNISYLLYKIMQKKESVTDSCSGIILCETLENNLLTNWHETTILHTNWLLYCRHIMITTCRQFHFKRSSLLFFSWDLIKWDPLILFYTFQRGWQKVQQKVFQFYWEAPIITFHDNHTLTYFNSSGELVLCIHVICYR